MSYVGVESLLIDDYLKATLGDKLVPVPALVAVGVKGVWDRVAPPEAVMPYVVWQSVDDTDVGGNGPGRWMVETIYDIKVIAMVDTFNPLAVILAKIDSLLEGLTVAFNGGTINGVRRTNTIRLTEVEQGQQIRHYGGTFRINAQPTL